jgi:alkylation response protein AidB-like acyl-CoA dehydrogenase
MSAQLLPAPSPQLRLLLDATERFIAREHPLPAVRETAGTPGADYYRRAADLGWFGMLGADAGDAHEALLGVAAIAAERGFGLQPGPFVGCNVVVDALTRYADPDQPHVAGVVAGDAMATWIPAGMVPFGGAGSGVHVSPDGAEGLLLTGNVGYVLDAGACDVLLVSALNQAGELVHVLVDASAPGVTVRELSGLDLTRQACAVGFDAVRADQRAVIGAARSGEMTSRMTHVAAVLTAAECVGAMAADLKLAVEHAKTRVAFGRPIGSFQAVKHQLADASLALEMSKGLVCAAAEALDNGDPRAGEIAHSCKAFVSEQAMTLTHTCFQVLGGIGYTWEHNHHLYMRRIGADAQTFGSSDWHLQQLADLV